MNCERFPKLDVAGSSPVSRSSLPLPGPVTRRSSWSLRHSVLRIAVPKSKCLVCGRYSRQPLRGFLPFQRASEAFQKAI